jgi:uncharacterized protein YoxC
LTRTPRAGYDAENFFRNAMLATLTVFTLISTIAGVLLKLAVLVLVGAAIPVLWQSRHLARKVHESMDQLRAQIAPVTTRAAKIADDVHAMTSAVRADVEGIHATVMEGNERIRAAMDSAERRLHDFNALLTMVREEAEELFVSSAAAVHGVRRGAAVFAEGNGPEFAVDDLDDSAGDDADELADPDDLEMADGDDSTTERAADGPAYPRLRPRAFRRGRP